MEQKKQSDNDGGLFKGESSSERIERLKKVYVYLHPTIQDFLWSSAKSRNSIISEIAPSHLKKKEKLEYTTNFLYNSTEKKSKTRPKKEKVKVVKKEKKEYKDNHKWIEFVKIIHKNNPKLSYSESTIHASCYWNKKKSRPTKKFYREYGDEYNFN